MATRREMDLRSESNSPDRAALYTDPDRPTSPARVTLQHRSAAFKLQQDPHGQPKQIFPCRFESQLAPLPELHAVPLFEAPDRMADRPIESGSPIRGVG